MDTQKPLESASAEAHLGKSVVIRGEVSGSEDLYLDGQVEGSIELRGNRLTLGPNGRVKANVTARSAVIHGKVEGNITASDRVDLKQSAVVTGDIVTQRISIDEGAYFKGGVDISRGASSQPQADAKAQPNASVAVGQGASAVGSAPQPAFTPLAEPRK